MSWSLFQHFNCKIKYTGCNSGKWKKVQANILKEPLVLLKQTIPQQKALDLSFNLAPWKWAWHYHEAATPSCPKRSQKPSAPTYAFHGKEAWRPPDNATPTFRVPNKSWDQGLSADVSFVSVLAMVLSEYWKRLEEIFWKRLFPRFPKNDENYKKKL